MLLFETRESANEDSELIAERSGISDIVNAASFKYFKQYLNNLEPDKHYHFWTGGQWNMHDLLSFLLVKTGPADCWLTTYAISEDAVRKIIYLHSKGLLNKVTCLFDYSVKEQKTGAYLLAKTHFSVALTSMHAKTLLLVNDQHKLIVTGSANWTRNPKAERQLLCTCSNVVDMDLAILQRLHSGEQVFKVR